MVIPDEKGQVAALLALPWPELLIRFAETAFTAKNEEFETYPDDSHGHRVISVADILLPPLTRQEIIALEAQLGSIPQDIKEMSLFARGFRGAPHWRWAGGGFPGINMFHKLLSYNSSWFVRRRAEELHMYDSGTGDCQSEAPEHWSQEKPLEVWYACGAVDSDNFSHYIVPPSTIMEGKGDDYREGQYVYMFAENWTAGAGSPATSLKESIAKETVEMRGGIDDAAGAPGGGGCGHHYLTMRWSC